MIVCIAVIAVGIGIIFKPASNPTTINVGPTQALNNPVGNTPSFASASSTRLPQSTQTYTTHLDEFPSCIARRLNVDQDELLSINNLSNGTYILPEGTILKIPQTGNSFIGVRALYTHPDYHVVAYGETIYSIACHYGDVDPMEIVTQNNLVPPYELRVGQVLRIP